MAREALEKTGVVSSHFFRIGRLDQANCFQKPSVVAMVLLYLGSGQLLS